MSKKNVTFARKKPLTLKYEFKDLEGFKYESEPSKMSNKMAFFSVHEKS